MWLSQVRLSTSWPSLMSYISVNSLSKKGYYSQKNHLKRHFKNFDSITVSEHTLHKYIFTFLQTWLLMLTLRLIWPVWLLCNLCRVYCSALREGVINCTWQGDGSEGGGLLVWFLIRWPLTSLGKTLLQPVLVRRAKGPKLYPRFCQTAPGQM